MRIIPDTVQVAKRHGTAAAKRLLWRLNSRQPVDRQCSKAQVPAIRYDGVPYFMYCGSWRCWYHAIERCGHEHKRLLIGMLWLSWLERLPLYFVTISWPSPEPEPAGFDRLLTKWRNMAARAGNRLHYYSIQVPKPAAGTWHAHIVASWLPSPVPSPTPARPERLRVERLEAAADKAGLRLHAETVASIEAVARYLEENLKQAVAAEEVPRVSASRTWPSDTRPSQEHEDVYDFLSAVYGAIYGRIGDYEPVRIRRLLASDTRRVGGDIGVHGRLRRDGHLYLSLQCNFHTLCHVGSSGDGHNRPAAGSLEPVQLPLPEPLSPAPEPRAWHWLSSWRRCSKCRRLLPAVMYQAAGGGRRRPDCRWCSSAYDRRRDSRPERKASRRWQAWLRRYKRLPSKRLL